MDKIEIGDLIEISPDVVIDGIHFDQGLRHHIKYKVVGLTYIYDILAVTVKGIPNPIAKYCCILVQKNRTKIIDLNTW
jgi:hypothetical protein